MNGRGAGCKKKKKLNIVKAKLNVSEPVGVASLLLAAVFFVSHLESVKVSWVAIEMSVNKQHLNLRIFYLIFAFICLNEAFSSS